MPDAIADPPTLITSTETASPDRTTRTRTIDDLVEEAGLLRSQTRLLGNDVAETNRRVRDVHQEALVRQLDARARRLAKAGMVHLLGELSESGLAWRDIAELAGVSVPAVRRWRQGETPTGEHLLDVARIVALVETLHDDHLVADVVAWMEMPLTSDAPLTAIDLAAAGRLADVIDVAAGHAAGEAVLDLWQPGWRERYHSDFEVFEAPDGELGTRAATTDTP